MTVSKRARVAAASRRARAGALGFIMISVSVLMAAPVEERAKLSRCERVVIALGMACLRPLALPIADQCTTRHVGTRNALDGRLLVRPRMQIRLGAERDNGMQLRFLLRHWFCLP